MSDNLALLLSFDEEHRHEADDLKAELASSLILAFTLLFASLFVLLLGNRLVKPTLFLSAFAASTTSALAVVPAILESNLLSDHAACALASLLPLGVGLVAGALSLKCLSVGFALLGAGAGGALGYTLYTGFLYRYPLPTGPYNATYLLSVFGFMLIGAVVLLRAQKALLIVATSAAGAVGCTAAIVLLLAHFNAQFLDGLKGDEHASAFMWGQAIVLLVLFLVGLSVQWKMEFKKRANEKAQASGLRNAQVPLILP